MNRDVARHIRLLVYTKNVIKESKKKRLINLEKGTINVLLPSSETMKNVKFCFVFYS